MSRAFIREANDGLNLLGKNIVVVGGTQGIGASTALRFASLGASVLICGRNDSRGTSMVQSLRTAYTSGSKFLRHNRDAKDEAPTYSFVKADLSTVEGCFKVVNEVKKWDKVPQDGLHALVMTAGSLNFGSRRETRDGIESTFAVNYLSKFIIANKLMPEIKSSERGRVVSVLHGGQDLKIEVDDLEIKNGFSFIRAANHTAGLIDVLTDQSARKHTTSPNSPRFIHIFPGIVNTDSITTAGFPWFVRYPAKLFLPFVATDPRTVADEIVYMCTNDAWIKANEKTTVSSEGKEVARAILVYPGLQVKPLPKSLNDEGLEEEVVTKSWDIVGKVAPELVKDV
ncbi:hypothetical protein HDU97_000143 [Phlyctochytrium planicorne]|nr:hypothetical protein HDU97_000143 [Phlyctochytrium planicorne]